MTNASIQELERALRAELERDIRVNLHQMDLQLLPQDDGYCLRGEAPDLASKRIAVNLARQLAGDRAVADRLCVRAPALGDGELGQHVCRNLTREAVFNEYAVMFRRGGGREALQQPRNAAYLIEVHADGGVVTLSGTVGSLTHRRLAEALCWWVPGCRHVDNRLSVWPEQPDSDDELNDAVRIVLEKDPEVEMTQLRAATAAGIVELSGFVHSDAAHDFALRDLWSVPGVWDVYDRTRVGPAPSA